MQQILFFYVPGTILGAESSEVNQNRQNRGGRGEERENNKYIS